MGDRSFYLQQAKTLINGNAGEIIATSSVYETAAWGKLDQPGFLNQVLLLHTALEPLPLLQQLLAIEIQMGRQRFEKMGPRTIDIDILFYNDVTLQSDELTIPHPHVGQRRFVLVPMNELAPELVHPIFKQTLAELLLCCPDQLPVTKFT